jgi:hypothetical protein
LQVRNASFTSRINRWLADIVVSKSDAETVNSLLFNQIGSYPNGKVLLVDNIT